MNKRNWMIGGIAAVAVALVAAMWTGAGVARAAASDVLRAQASAQQAEDKGVLVLRVMPDSPAAKAGLKQGDILLKVDDADVNAVADLVQALKSHKSGDDVKLTLMRGDDQRVVMVKLGENKGLAYLGVMPFMLAPDVGAQPQPSAPMTVTQQGALIVEVVSGGPAEKAGIQQGDVIRSVDGKAIDDKNSLADAIGKLKPGDSAKLEVIRGSETASKIAVTLGENPNKKGAAYLGVTYSPAMPMAYGRQDKRPGRSMPMPSMPFRVAPGAAVRNVMTDSPAEKAGLKVGDVIVTVGDKQIDRPQTLADAVGSYKPGDTVTLTVKREVDGKTNTVDLTVTLGENPDKKGSAYLGVQLAAGMRTMPHDDGDQGWLPNFDELPDRFSKFFDGLPSLPTPGQTQPPAGQDL